MKELDFMMKLHSSTARDYLARVNDPVYPKHMAASLAKQWDYDYWDGDRRINYGGYSYIPGRWSGVAHDLIQHYDLQSGSRVLDVGCGKGFLLYELKKINSKIEVVGLDISKYAVENCHPCVGDDLLVGTADNLPFRADEFDLVVSINTLHNMYVDKLALALAEIDRVAVGGQAYICVESYRTEVEKANLLYWQVTCEIFFTPKEWVWFMETFGYRGDYSFIYFE